MKGITLRESGLVVHPLLPQCLKPPNSFTSRLLSFKLKALPKKQSVNLSSRQQSLLFSRNCVLSACEEWFGDLLQKVTEGQHGLEHKYVDCKKREETIALGNKSEDCCVSDHVPVNNNFRSGYYTASDLSVSTTLFNNVLKFMVLFGLLTFQGSLPAVALPDIASGLQSIPYVGDLGDISTGILADIFLRTGRQNLFHCSTFSC